MIIQISNMALAYRSRLLTLVLALVIMQPGLGFAQDNELKERVADLSYGHALYHYFQGHELNALTELHLADVKGGIQGHGDNPELMKAGISLAYGMADVAQEIFIELLDQNRPERVRNAAWYYLARLHYLRENWEPSQEAVSHITDNVERNLVPSVQMIRTNLAIKTNRTADAQVLIEDRRAYGEFLPYAYFNVATALSREENHRAAMPYYEKAVDAVYDLEPVTEDDLALIDRIRTASGYNFLLAGFNSAAVEEFSQVQLSSLDSDMALLGYGRASVQQSNHVNALRPWLELAKRSLFSPAAQEALLSIPVAYETLGASGEALSAYELAETTYVSEIERIDELLEFLEQNRLDAAALLKEPKNWFETRAEAASAPRVRQLAELFSLNRFQAKVHEFQDISQLRDMIDMWNRRLELYSGMLDERQILRERDRDALYAMELESQIQGLEQESLSLRQKLAQIETERDYLALTSGTSSDHLKRVTDSEERIDKLHESGESTEEFDEPLRLYSGLMLWDAAEDFAVDIYAGKRSVAAVEEELEAFKETHRRVTEIFSSAPDIAPYQERISNLSARLDQGSIDLDRLIESSEEALLAEIKNELNTQKRRLRVYLGQARLSIARIYDANVQGLGK